MSGCWHSIGSTVFPKQPPVEGLPTTVQCPRCGERTVVIVYNRLASRVLFCTSCEYVWTVRGPTVPLVSSRHVARAGVDQGGFVDLSSTDDE